jgi:DNA polymerase-3 subunit beta
VRKNPLCAAGVAQGRIPVFPEFQEDRSISIEVKALQEMIKKTHFAVSTDETRYILNGIFFILDKGIAKMVATMAGGCPTSRVR